MGVIVVTGELTALNPVLRRILEEKRVMTEAGEPRPLHSAIFVEEGFFLQEIIRQNRPRFSLEIGCAYGVSSLFICQALNEIGAERHIIIDPFQLGHDHTGPDPGYEGIGLANLERAGLSNLVTFYPELSYQCLPRLDKEGCRLDFAFIDGMHTFDYVLVDFFYVDKMLNAGGVVVFDDLSYRSVRKVCRYILCNLLYSAIGPDVSVSPGKKGMIERASNAKRWCENMLREGVTVPDAKIGLPRGNFVALRKNAEDRIGDGPAFSRRWDTHHRF